MSDQEELKSVLNYEPETGVFTWIPCTGRGMHYRNGVAGSVHKNGYRYIMFKGKQAFAHRLAWLYMTGVWPENQIDHINGGRDDNRWVNLREADNGQNMQNISGPHGKTFTGELGVTFRRNRFEARIQQGKKRLHIGTYKTKDEAVAAYLAAKLVLHTHNDRFVK